MFENSFKLIPEVNDDKLLPAVNQKHPDQYLLKSRVNILIPANYDKAVDVKTGVTVDMKLHHQLIIFGRKIDVLKNNLVIPDLQILNHPIKHELTVPLINLSNNDIYLNAGDMIATAMFVKIDRT